MQTTARRLNIEDPLDYEEPINSQVRQKRVLVAEDDGAMRSILTWALWEDGYDVVEAADGLEVCRYLDPRFLDARMLGRLHDIHLVLSDLRMPRLSGMDVLVRLREHDKETPFILITAFGDAHTHAQAKLLGASLVVDKPFDVDYLLDIIRRILPPR